jgi:hypothetical protein
MCRYSFPISVHNGHLFTPNHLPLRLICACEHEVPGATRGAAPFAREEDAGQVQVLVCGEKTAGL